MSTGTGSSQGLFGTFPYESVITPATIAGLVIAAATYLLDVGIYNQSIGVDSLVTMLIGAIGTIALVAGILGIVVSGADTTVLIVGAILVYVGGLLVFLLNSVYAGVSLQLTAELFLQPLYRVVLMVGIGIGVNWIGVEVSL